MKLCSSVCEMQSWDALDFTVLNTGGRHAACKFCVAKLGFSCLGEPFSRY